MRRCVSGPSGSEEGGLGGLSSLRYRGSEEAHTRQEVP